MKSILHQFLASHLFNLEIDDPTFSKLQAAAVALQKKELKQKKNVLRYVLVALDPDISAEDPVIENVKQIVSNKSATIVSKSKDPITTVYRAIIIEALNSLAHSDIDSARIIWLIGSYRITYYKLGREEKIIVKEFIEKVGEIVEEGAQKHWEVNNIKLEPKPIPVVDLGSITTISIDALNSGRRLKEVPYTVQNYQYVGQEVNNWRSLYSDALDEIINSVIEKINKKGQQQKNSFQVLQSSLKSYFESSNDYLAEIKETVLSVNHSLNNRSKLLWWKEALYSDYAKLSYRQLDRGLLPMIIAYDLFKDVTEIYPHSIDYILKEALLKVLGNSFKISFKQFAESMNNNLQILDKLELNTDNESFRLTLLEYFKLSTTESTNLNFIEKIGFSPDEEIEVLEISVWIFHELQAFRIAGIIK